jgi:hypothetical protein
MTCPDRAIVWKKTVLLLRSKLRLSIHLSESHLHPNFQGKWTSHGMIQHREILWNLELIHGVMVRLSWQLQQQKRRIRQNENVRTHGLLYKLLRVANLNHLHLFKRPCNKGPPMDFVRTGSR